MTKIKRVTPIDFMWPTLEPFLFCVHHLDHYPAGNEANGLDDHHFIGRNMGSDFETKDGFRLYHGRTIPGFPVHPHRGFETITIVRKGYIDHADSLGAAGRYGEGDVQWMTAGGGVQHSEMFPLLHRDKENTVELFQIWLNLPKKNKMVDADFKMLWSEDQHIIKAEKFQMTLISGEWGGEEIYPAPKNSWAADPNNLVNIYLVKLEEGGEFKIPSQGEKTHRMLYFFEGIDLSIEGQQVGAKSAIELQEKVDIEVVSQGGGEFLYLEARPIGEPIVQHGPFVMNTREEIVQAISDYQRTQFGGWSWERSDMIHGDKKERFAKFPDGRVERRNDIIS